MSVARKSSSYWLRWLLNRGFQALVLFGFTKFILSLKWDKVWSMAPKIGEGILTTIWLTAISLAIGFVIAWPLAILRAKRNPEWLAKIADGFVALFRGTPLLVQVYIIYYGLGSEKWVQESFLWPVLREAYYCVIIGFSLNAAAYACEIFRGALVNGGMGEREAAMSLGMKNWQVNWLVWVPASWRRALPQYGNEMIFMMHGTAIAGLVTISDVFGVAREINSRFYLTYEGLMTAAFIYVALTIGLSFLIRAMEKHFLSYQNR